MSRISKLIKGLAAPLTPPTYYYAPRRAMQSDPHAITAELTLEQITEAEQSHINLMELARLADNAKINRR